LARQHAQPDVSARRPFTYDRDLSVDDILDSPFLAFGTESEIAEHFRRVRDELGISYWTLTPRIAEPFLPVLEALRC